MSSLFAVYLIGVGVFMTVTSLDGIEARIVVNGAVWPAWVVSLIGAVLWPLLAIAIVCTVAFGRRS